jgi:hypothetical protein
MAPKPLPMDPNLEPVEYSSKLHILFLQDEF